VNEKMKFNLIGAGIAFIIVGSLATWGITSYMHGMDTQVKPSPAPTITESVSPSPTPSQAPTVAPTPGLPKSEMDLMFDVHTASINALTVHYAVNNDGQVIPVPFARLPKKVAAHSLELSITKHEDAVYLISNIHDKFNEMVGWDNDKKIFGDDQNWKTYLERNVLSPELYDRMAAVVASEDTKKDFANMAALARIAHVKHNVQALIEMHRIIHDLDFWVYNNPGSAKPDKYGAAHAYKNPPKSTVANVEAFISENQ
jgi:hypothetical protein